jgi:hypothetical protein
MIAEIRNAAAKGLEDLSYLASTEVRAGWEKLETAWLDLEKTAMDLPGDSARTARAAADVVADEIGAGYVLIRRLF